MAAKDAALKKRLIKEALILAAALAALAAGGTLLSNYDDDMQSEERLKTNDNNTLRSEQASITEQLGTGFEISSYYEAYLKNHNGEMVLNRELTTKWLAVLREKHHLVNLSVTISAVNDATGGATLKSGTMIKSEVHLTFGAISDNSVYDFIESLQRELPGIVLVHDLKLSRTSELSRETLINLSQHRITPMVTGELSFLWIGIRPKTEDKSGVNANASVPSAPAHGNPHGR